MKVEITEPAVPVVKVTVKAAPVARTTAASLIPGPRGPQGIQGIQGPKGNDGVNGTNGTNGMPGTNGTNGIDGADGIDGQPGTNGRDGIDGEPGTPGTNGTNGVDGQPGKDGEPGLPGRDGIDGANGTNGVDGKDGESINGDDYILAASKGQPFGVAELDGSGNIAQRIKSAAGSTPPAMRDSEGVGNGKASVYAASITSDGNSVIIAKTGIWRSELSYAFRAFGQTDDGVVDLTFYRNVVNGAAFYGYMNNGNVPVVITFGMSNDGYSSWAIAGITGRAQIVVTDVVCTGNGTGDNEVRLWSMTAANDTGSLGQHVTVARQTLA